MRYEFENYEFDATESVLRADGTVVHIEPQVCRIIELLITNHGRMVERDEIQREIWGDRTIMPSVIDNRIRAARAALGDDGKQQRLIKTFPNAGYKFVGNVTTVYAAANQPEGIKSSISGLVSWFRELPLIPTSVIMVLFAAFAMMALIDKPAPVNKPIATLNTGVTAPDAHKKIAVLQFVANSDDARDFAMHLSQQTISALSNIDPLAVVAPRSSFSFTKDSTTQEIASLLGVGYILDGVFLSDDKTYNLTARLVAVDGDKIIWSDSFNGDKSIQSRLEFEIEVAGKIAASVANSLGHSVSGKEELVLGAKEFGLFQKGIERLGSHKSGDLSQAVDLFSQVVESRPNFLPAYMYLSDASNRATSSGTLNRSRTIKAMSRLTERARRLSPESPETFVTAGNLERLKGNSAAALGHYDRALAKNPNLALAHIKKAEVLHTLSRMPDALASYKKALAFDPFSSELVLNVARVLFSMGEISEALRLAKRNLLWDPDDLKTRLVVAEIEMSIGNLLEAKRLLGQALKRDSENLELQLGLFRMYSHMGLLQELPETVSHSSVKAIAAAHSPGLKGKANELLANISPTFVATHINTLLCHNQALYEKYVEFVLPEILLTAETPIALDQTLDAVVMLHILMKQNDGRAAKLRNRLERLFASKSPQELHTVEELSAAIGFYAMTDAPDKALLFFDEANRRNMLFLGWLESCPIFAKLKVHSHYPSRLAQMMSNRDRFVSGAQSKL